LIVAPVSNLCQKYQETDMRRLTRSYRRTLRTALHGLSRNRMRSALTTLGIVIGVAAVIAMMEIGEGSSRMIQQSIASMGAANIMVQPGTASSGGVTFGAGTTMTLTPTDCEAIIDECPAVRAAAPVVRARTQVIYQGRNWVPTSIYGTTPDFLDVREWTNLEDGVSFTDADVRNTNKVCLLGRTIVRELFQGRSPIGEEIRINNVAFRVIGVLTPKGANTFGMDQDDVILAPWTSIKYRVSNKAMGSVNQSAAASDSTQSIDTLNNLYPGQSTLYPVPSATEQANNPLPVRFVNVDQMMVAAQSGQQVPAAIEQMTRLLRLRHHLAPDEPDDFNMRDMTEMTNMLSSTSFLMTKLLLSVALISLVVGGVGIMNIMLVSVTERTREIGLRMAVGARARDILRQFLFEAVVLCLLGGALGILLGRGSSLLVRTFLGWATQLSVGAIIAAVAVSVSVGVVFGYYPAWKASRLDPIEALRYE
jgi:ABC-type antimicrobial peptide transport system permease subunit